MILSDEVMPELALSVEVVGTDEGQYVGVMNMWHLQKEGAKGTGE